MRIICWNCQNMHRNMAQPKTSYSATFLAKWQFIKAFNPDILVLQECPMPLGEDTYFWRDQIGVYSFNGWQASPYQPARDMPPYFLPVRVSGARNFNLLGVWSQPPYVKSVYNGLDYFKDFLQETDAVILGDFNATYRPKKPKERETTITFRKLVDEKLISGLNLVSSYHKFFQEILGEEKQYTYFHVDTKPFHIDFCFVPQTWEVSNVQIKSYKPGKDHTALIVDVVLPDN
jgi:exonuclease III